MMDRAAGEAGGDEEEVCKIQDDYPESEGEEGESVYGGEEEEDASQGVEARGIGLLVHEQRGLEPVAVRCLERNTRTRLHLGTIVHNCVQQLRNLDISLECRRRTAATPPITAQMRTRKWASGMCLSEMECINGVMSYTKNTPGSEVIWPKADICTGRLTSYTEYWFDNTWDVAFV